MDKFCEECENTYDELIYDECPYCDDWWINDYACPQGCCNCCGCVCDEYEDE